MDIPPIFNILQEDTPTYPEGPEGSRIISGWAYPAFSRLHTYETVTTIQLDFVTPWRIEPQTFTDVLTHPITTEILTLHGQDPICYMIWEKEEWQVSIPEEICFFDWCFTPPWAGETLVTIYVYRTWLLVGEQIASPMIAGARPDVRGFVIPGFAVIWWALAFLLALGGTAGIIKFMRGELTADQVMAPVEDIIYAPGENVSRGMVGPLMAFGFVLVAASIAVPFFVTKVTAGPIQVEAGTMAPARTTRRRGS